MLAVKELRATLDYDFTEEKKSRYKNLSMEDIIHHLAAGHIDEKLLRRILEAILNYTYDTDEELKLDIFDAISVEEEYY